MDGEKGVMKLPCGYCGEVAYDEPTTVHLDCLGHACMEDESPAPSAQ